MSKIFNGNYTRLDDDVSFQLVRTNPMLTTNTKLMYDGEKMYLESYDANPTLVTQKYKNVSIKGTSPFNRDIRNFLLGTHKSAYDVFQKESDLSICDSYDKQFETMYWCGAESINSKQYPQELGFIAPLYLRKKLPNYFVIFKVDGPSNFNLTIDENTGLPVDDTFDFNTDIINNAKIIKSFDLREGTVIGNYIKKYIEQTDFEFDKSIHINFSTNEITYYGIDKKYGVLTKKKENFKTELLENDNTIIHSDDWITSGFKRNNLIFPYIINFEFLFDDDDTTNYKFARYFGMYCNDIDLFEFEAKYSDGNVVMDKPEEILKETILTGTDFKNIRITVDKNDDLGRYEYDRNDKLSFYYIKDKNNVLHQVNDIYNNYFNTNDTKIIEITDKKFDLSSICGFEKESVSTYCERLSTIGKSEFSFTINKKFKQGEQIKFYKSGEVYAKFTAVTKDDENPIEPGKYVGMKFSSEGSLKEITKALCDCINSLDNNIHFFDAYYKDTTIVVRCVFSNENVNLDFNIDVDESLIKNNRIRINGNTKNLEGGCDTYGCTFKIKAEDKTQFTNNRYLKSGDDDKGNAKIISCVPYINLDDVVDYDYYEVSTDNNGVFVSISNTNMVEIVDRFYPKFGILSFFPVKDFDFDMIFSNYGSYKAFSDECKRLEEKSKSVFSSLNGPVKYERTSVTTIANGYLKDCDGRPIESEYEYFMENLIPELSTENKSVPSINKWGYYDEEKDSCENNYRLNMSKIFGTSNLSSNTFTYEFSINEHTHSMPYYMTRNESLCSGDNYQYVYDSIGLYIYTPDENMTIYDAFVDRCISVFMDTDVDNFDKLFCNKSDNNKRFNRKYSRMKFGSDNTFSSTLFRGVKFNIKKIVDDNEVNGVDFNDYKFSFLYIPVELPSIYVSNKVYFVKNDKFKFIVGFVIVNTLSGGITTEDYQNNEYYICNTYDFNDFCKAYIYGGCYGLLSLPLYNNTEHDTVTVTNMPIDDVFGVKQDVNGRIDIKQVNVINQSIRLMMNNMDDPESIERIVVHNLSGSRRYVYEDVINDDGIVYISNNIISTNIYVGNGMFVDIVFKNKIDENTGESIVFKDFYSVFSSLSTYNIKENINGDTLMHDDVVTSNVNYYSTSDDVYKINVEDPTSFNTYDIFTSTPQIVPESGVSTPSASEVTLKENINEISLKTINRYSGYYNPICNDILVFDDYIEGDKLFKFSNTRFDTDYRDMYGGFGEIKNLWFHKVNEDNPDKIITMMNPFYPAIGQFALDYRNYNIFESNWDKNYYTTQLNITNSELAPGTAGSLNNVSMFGSKYIHVPEEITIDTFNTSIDWNDELIINNGKTDADVMWKEVNGNTVSFYMFIYNRIVRYFAEESELRKSFEKYINPKYSFGDKTTIEDDIKSYIEKNIMKLYYLDDVKLWINGRKVGMHDSKIENDYITYLPYNNNEKLNKNLKKVSTFSIKKMTNNLFDRCITYNLKSGYKEDFGFSFTIKKI